MQNNHLPYFSFVFRFFGIKICQIMSFALKEGMDRFTKSWGFPAFFCNQNLSVKHMFVTFPTVFRLNKVTGNWNRFSIYPEKSWKRRRSLIVWFSSCSYASCDIVRNEQFHVRQRPCLPVTAPCLPHRTISYWGFFWVSGICFPHWNKNFCVFAYFCNVFWKLSTDLHYNFLGLVTTDI